MTFLGHCRAAAIGSLPHTDVREAVAAVFDHFPDLPAWPQLPKVSRAEGMNEQASVGMPGVRLEGGRLRLIQDEAFYLGVERLLAAHEAGDVSMAAIDAGAAAGLDPFLAEVRRRGVAEAKAQISGPVTVGMAILGEDGNPVLYDDTLREVLVKFLNLRARWLASRLREAGARPVVFIDEPFLASFGTPFFGWGAAQVRGVLAGVAEGLEAAGSHCCANTDWTIFLSGGLDVVSFDAYGYAKNFLVYRDDLAAFLDRGGTLAWGIVPTDPLALAGESLDGLRWRLLDLVDEVGALGFSRERVLRQSLLTPSCGLGSRDLPTARRVVPLVRDLAAGLRAEFLSP